VNLKFCILSNTDITYTEKSVCVLQVVFKFVFENMKKHLSLIFKLLSLILIFKGKIFY